MIFLFHWMLKGREESHRKVTPVQIIHYLMLIYISPGNIGQGGMQLLPVWQGLVILSFSSPDPLFPSIVLSCAVNLFFFSSNSAWVLSLLGFKHIIDLFYSEYKSMFCTYDREMWGFLKCIMNEREAFFLKRVFPF